MGFFSWKTSDTKKSIPNIHQARKRCFPVKMLDDKGNVWKEGFYDGYGIFGGKDFYELLAEMNGQTTREEGIDLAFSGDKTVKKPKLVSYSCTKKWSELPNSPSCRYQGYFY